MKHISSLLLLLGLWLIIDACNSSTNTTEASLSAESSGLLHLLKTDLCDTTQHAFDLPYGRLPLVDSIPGSNSDSVLVAFLQNVADNLSWKNFIALNWLATPAGTPDSTVCFGSRDGVTVWEHWMPQSRLFTPALLKSDGSKSSNWQVGLTQTGHPRNSGNTPLLRQSKFNELSPEGPEKQPVPNQHGLNTLYEVFYNRQIYDYIMAGKLNTLSGQKDFVKKWPSLTKGIVVVDAVNHKDTIGIEKAMKRVYMPITGAKDTVFDYTLHMLVGNRDSTKQSTLFYYRSRGAMMIKSAWMMLTEKEDASSYHTRKVTYQGKPVVLGLVALHLAQKTAEAPRWVWSTFEHIRNAPMLGKNGYAVLEPGVDYLYFDETDTDTAKYNKLDKKRNRVQVVRIGEKAPSAEKLNKYYHNLIRKVNPKSVWLNYRLVGSQWPKNDPDPFVVNPLEENNRKPALLANALMETYHQKTSDCMGCHVKARILGDQNSAGYVSDFLWGMALQKQKKP